MQATAAAPFTTGGAVAFLAAADGAPEDADDGTVEEPDEESAEDAGVDVSEVTEEDVSDATLRSSSLPSTSEAAVDASDEAEEAAAEAVEKELEEVAEELSRELLGNLEEVADEAAEDLPEGVLVVEREGSPLDTPVEEPRWTGPRFGIIRFTGEAADALESEHGVGSVLTVCGWQFEYRNESADGMVTLVEFIPYVAGLEHGLALPSVDLLFGFRMGPNTELAFGPSLSTDGLGFGAAFAGTIQAGEMGIPISLTFGGNQAGAWLTLTCGWNLRH